MHELSIALSLIELATEEAERHGAVQVQALHVRIGPLSGVVADALLSAWELAREQTLMQNARLVIEESPVITFCAQCDQERPVISIQHICCATCGAPAAEIISGRELDLVALEVPA